LNLTNDQIEQVIILFSNKPQPKLVKAKVSKALAMLLTQVIKEFLVLVGTQQTLTLSYSKEENSLVERTNKELNRHLIALTFDRNIVADYKLCLPIIQRILNSSYNKRTGISPAELLFGNAMKLDRGLFLTPAERNTSVLIKPHSL
jgi:hypothetical protein